MATIKAYTDLEQSKRLAEFLPLESADMVYIASANDDIGDTLYTAEYKSEIIIKECDTDYINCWSLAALLNILHNKAKDIPSLSGGGYKDGKYVSDWCLDYEFENGDYKATFADNPVDACYEMIIKLHELNLL